MLAILLFDQWWWFFLPGLILGLYAQFKLTSTYNKYIQVPNESGLSGAQAAREILDSSGLPDVPVAEVAGRLTDHYDPAKRALFLSSDNFHGRSVAAVGVAAHEAGHALQHKAAYVPLHLRMVLVPITGFASQAVYWILLLGMFMHFARLVWPAIIAFSIITLFQLITLPVEFDASRRAKEMLLRLGLVRKEESRAVSQVLSAAALTYVAAMVASLFDLLHFVMIARNSERD
jgi:Zn-dependent membrane protease YugP